MTSSSALLDAALGATREMWVTTACSGCGKKQRVEVKIPDVRSRVAAIELLLREGLGRPPQAEEAASPRLPRTAEAVEKLGWGDMKLIFATSSQARSLRSPRTVETLLRERVVALDEDQRQLLRQALDEVPSATRALLHPPFPIEHPEIKPHRALLIARDGKHSEGGESAQRPRDAAIAGEDLHRADQATSGRDHRRHATVGMHSRLVDQRLTSLRSTSVHARFRLTPSHQVGGHPHPSDAVSRWGPARRVSDCCRWETARARWRRRGRGLHRRELPPRNLSPS